MSSILSCQITLPCGEEITVYPIGKLASALNRSSLTIRRWEQNGIIPSTFFVNKRGHRMYSQEQIDIIVQCAKECNIKQGYGMTQTDFSLICHERLGELKKRYLQK